MTGTTEGKRRGPRDPIMRAFEILQWMVEAEGSSWGLREIAVGVDMHPSTLHRVISHLIGPNIIRQDADTGRYGLGLEFMRLALKAATSNAVIEIALPVLQETSSAIGESMLLALYEPLRREMMFAATIDSPHPVRNVIKTGDFIPITVGSTGLAILASLPESDQNTILETPIVAMTPQTVTDRDELRQILEQIREQGYALTAGQRTSGTAGISAPIWGWNDRLVGAITLLLPKQRFKRHNEPNYAHLVMTSANRISRMLRSSDPLHRGVELPRSPSLPHDGTSSENG